MNALVMKLVVNTDCLGSWPSLCKGVPRAEKLEAFSAAEPPWVLRMLDEGKLLVHPAVAAQLRASGGEPSELHRQMIWASVLASLEGDDSKERYAEIRRRLKGKYKEMGWFEVHKRVKPAFAARMRLKKQEKQLGPALRTFAERSVFVAGMVQDERQQALEMIPKE